MQGTDQRHLVLPSKLIGFKVRGRALFSVLVRTFPSAKTVCESRPHRSRGGIECPTEFSLVKKPSVLWAATGVEGKPHGPQETALTLRFRVSPDPGQGSVSSGPCSNGHKEH